MFIEWVQDKKFKKIGSLIRKEYPSIDIDDYKSVYYECLWKTQLTYSTDKLTSIYTYFAAILKNTCVSLCRYNKLRQNMSQLSIKFDKGRTHSDFLKIEMNDLLKSLSKDEYDIIYKRFYENKTLEEIGREDGLSGELIRQKEKTILNRLKMIC